MKTVNRIAAAVSLNADTAGGQASAMLPTILLSDFDRFAVDEALRNEPSIEASLVADALETIDVLDALSAESLNIGNIDADLLSLLVDADLATSSAWLCAALGAAMDARTRYAAQN